MRRAKRRGSEAKAKQKGREVRKCKDAHRIDRINRRDKRDRKKRCLPVTGHVHGYLANLALPSPCCSFIFCFRSPSLRPLATSHLLTSFLTLAMVHYVRTFPETRIISAPRAHFFSARSPFALSSHVRIVSVHPLLRLPESITGRCS